eukprot:3402333-Pyramimonas_sp.AAC.1
MPGHADSSRSGGGAPDPAASLHTLQLLLHCYHYHHYYFTITTTSTTTTITLLRRWLRLRQAAAEAGWTEADAG